MPPYHYKWITGVHYIDLCDDNCGRLRLLPLLKAGYGATSETPGAVPSQQLVGGNGRRVLV